MSSAVSGTAFAPARVRQRGYVVDPVNSYLSYSGLSIGRLNPGQPVTCQFTVSHHRGLFLGVFPSTDTFTGVVIGPDGLVVLKMSQQTVTLNYGRFVTVRLISLGNLPDRYAGQTISVAVGPASALANAIIGQPLGVSDGILVASAPVPAQVTGPPTVPTPPNTLEEVALIGGGVLALGVVAALALHRRYRATY